MGQPPGQQAFRLVREASPQHIRDNQTQNPVAEKFEPLIAVAVATAAAPAAGGERAAMGQRLGQQRPCCEIMAEAAAQRRERGRGTGIIRHVQ